MDTTETQETGPDAADLPLRPLLCDELDLLLTRQQEAITTLRLAAYAADAMRVFAALEQHADMSRTFDAMLMVACPDWRNPSATDNPADALFMALKQSIFALQRSNGEMEKVLAAFKRIEG